MLVKISTNKQMTINLKLKNSYRLIDSRMIRNYNVRRIRRRRRRRNRNSYP